MSTHLAASPPQTLPTFVLGADLARVGSSDPVHRIGSVLGNGYLFDADAVLALAESHGLNFDAYLSLFLEQRFRACGHRTSYTVMVEVDYVHVTVWLASPRRNFDVPFEGGLAPLLDYGRDAISHDARPFGRWAQGQFHRVHPAVLPTDAVETFGGVKSHEVMPSALREDILSRPTAYGWWSVPHLTGPMVVRMLTGPVAIPQALYLWAGEKP